MKTQLRMPIFVLFVLLLASLACALPGGQQSIVQAPTPFAVTVSVPTQAPTLTPMAEPTLAPTPIPTTAGRMVMFENVQLILPEGLAQNQASSIMPAETSGTPRDIQVSYTKIDLLGYTLSNTSSQASIYVFPTEGFSNAADTIANLKDVMALHPQDVNSMPYLPLVGTVQMLHAQVKYLDFGSGSGVRYLTQYSSGLVPVTSQDLFYTFQGLTADGKYYVSVVMPVANNALPATKEDYDMAGLVGEKYMQYIGTVSSQLEAQPDSTFTPTLSTLDALVQSIKVR